MPKPIGGFYNTTHITVDKGHDLNLTSYITEVPFWATVLWKFYSDDGSEKIISDYYETYNNAKCSFIIMISLHDVGLTDAGIYSCVIQSSRDLVSLADIKVIVVLTKN